MEGEFLLEGTNGSRPGDTESGKNPRHRKTNLPKAPVQLSIPPCLLRRASSSSSTTLISSRLSSHPPRDDQTT